MKWWKDEFKQMKIKYAPRLKRWKLNENLDSSLKGEVIRGPGHSAERGMDLDVV